MTWKKWLSYWMPITKEVESDFSGTLEITWKKGRKVLDSRSANYSYGALQEVLRVGLNHTSWKRTGHALVLGMGAGSVIEELVNGFDHSGPITGVEWDSAIIELAYREFNLNQYPQVQVVEDDAFQWMEECVEGVFDLIVVDLFIDDQVHPDVLSELFINRLKTLAKESAGILINAGMKSDSGHEIFREFGFTPVPIIDHPNSLWVCQLRV